MPSATSVGPSPADRVSEMEAAFESAVKSGKIPGAVIMAKDISGTCVVCLETLSKARSTAPEY